MRLLGNNHENVGKVFAMQSNRIVNRSKILRSDFKIASKVKP
jgi:hypothetical protein